jgi:hypothetical protein
VSEWLALQRPGGLGVAPLTVCPGPAQRRAPRTAPRAAPFRPAQAPAPPRPAPPQATRHAEFQAIDEVLRQAGGNLGAADFRSCQVRACGGGGGGRGWGPPRCSRQGARRAAGAR